MHSKRQNPPQHQAWPEAKFVLVPDAGHSCTEPGIQSALVAATDAFASKGGF